MIGLSILSGTHLSVCRELMEGLAKEGVQDKVVLVGGIIPRKDVSPLKEMGVAEVFGPDSAIEEIAQCIEDEIKGLKSRT